MSDTAPAERRAGDNRPPLVENPPEIIAALAREPDNAALIRRRDELLATYRTVPETLDTDDEAKKATELGVMVRTLRDEADNRRKSAQVPFDAAVSAVRGWFAPIFDPMEAARVSLRNRLTDYGTLKDSRERALRKAESDRRQKEADDARAVADAAAAKSRGPKTAEKAAIAGLEAQGRETIARESAVRAEAPIQETARLRTDSGASLSMTVSIGFRSIERDKLDLEKLRPYIPTPAIETAIRAWIKANKPKVPGAGEPQPLAGVEIYNANKARF